MRRFVRLLSYALITLAVIAAAITLLAWHFLQDEDFLKSQLHTIALKHTGRGLTIDGSLRLGLGRETTLEASGIRFANATWAEPPDMVRIGRLRAVIDIPSLFGDTPVISLLSVEDCAVTLVKNADGEANWAMLPPATDEPVAKPRAGKKFPVLLLETEIRNCRLSHSAPDREQPLVVEVSELSQQLGEDQHWRAQGTGSIAGEPVSIDGWLAPTVALKEGGPIEHRLEIHAGKVTLLSSGTLQDVSTGQGANMNFEFRGPDIAEVLDHLGLPAIGQGAFDFRLSLDTAGRMTQLDVQGDLGDMQINAEGELDRLLHPERGQLHASVEGPNLEALGETLGVPGLVAETYEAETRMTFEPGMVRLQSLDLKTPQDSLAVSGILATAKTFAGSDLGVKLQSAEIGRWAPAIGRPVASVGTLALDGRVSTDAAGMIAVAGTVNSGASSLTLRGPVGPVSGPLQADLEIDFNSPDPRPLAALAGLDDFPAAPLSVRGKIAMADKHFLLQGVSLQLGSQRAGVDGTVNIGAGPNRFAGSQLDLRLDSPNASDLGHLFKLEGWPAAPLRVQGKFSRPDQRIRLEKVVLDLAGHLAHIDGYLSPVKEFSGGAIEVQLDSPDVAELALLFGEEGLPHEALNLSATLRPDGKGLRFQTNQVGMGDIRLAASGYMADLQEPLRLDADFDLSLPSLRLLKFLARGKALPDLPFSARGRVRAQPDRTGLEAVDLQLGTFQGRLEGDIFTDRRFALALQASGTNASALQFWSRTRLPAEPFSLQVKAAGYPADFELTEIAAQVGASQASGNLRFEFGAARRISGRVESPVFDLAQWLAKETPEATAAAAPASAPQSALVFDDRPVMQIVDIGIGIDLDVSVAELLVANTSTRDIKLGLRLAGRRLEINPFSMQGKGGGQLSGAGVLDGSGSIPRLHLELDGEDIRLGLSAAKNQDMATYPKTELHIVLDGNGVTRRELASGLDGKLRVFVGRGQVAAAAVRLLLSDFLTELFQALNPFSEKNEYTRLDCMVIAADITDGRMDVFPIVMQTEPVTILSQGTVDLHSERIDLAFNSKPRQGLGITAATVINPLIKVGGTLKQPAIELNPTGAIVSGGVAVATAGLSILAKGFSDRFMASKDPCGDARKEIENKER